MKKLIAVGLFVAFLLPLAYAAEEKAAAQAKEFWVYKDRGTRENHFVPSGWMGDYGDIKINDQSSDKLFKKFSNTYGSALCSLGSTIIAVYNMF